MRFNRVLAVIICISLFGSTLGWAKANRATKKSGGKHISVKSASKAKKGKKFSARSSRRGKNWRGRGQKAIGDDRTREIQAALIRENYLSGTPTGVMDSATKSALIKLQKDNGWQGKVVPDSRALIKLGLGPNHENLLNPDTAVLTFAPAEIEVAPR